MKEKRTRAKKKEEHRKQFCFTLLPSTMAKVEKLAEKDFLSVSAKVQSILRGYVTE